jgi:hypothetical protein
MRLEGRDLGVEFPRFHDDVEELLAADLELDRLRLVLQHARHLVMRISDPPNSLRIIGGRNCCGSSTSFAAQGWHRRHREPAAIASLIPLEDEIAPSKGTGKNPEPWSRSAIQ